MWRQRVGKSVFADLPIQSNISHPVAGTTLAVMFRILAVPEEPKLPPVSDKEEVRSTTCCSCSQEIA
jgi:hypothetical protein